LAACIYQGNPRVYFSNAADSSFTLGNDVMEIFYNGANWQFGSQNGNITSVSGAWTPLAGIGLTVCLFNKLSGIDDMRIYHTATFTNEVWDEWHEISELSFITGVGWQHARMWLGPHSNALNRHTVRFDSPLTSCLFEGDPRVYFIGSDDNVHELSFEGDHWASRDFE
jgi:hypothetical protein